MKRAKPLRLILCALLIPFIFPAFLYPQTDGDEYAAKIKEYTTDPRFLNELIDHIPPSETVPSPLDHFGTIIGAPEVLHYTDEIYGYLKALSGASPRVRMRDIGETEEGRRMVEVIIASEELLSQADTHRGYLNRLADPRGLEEAEAEKIITDAKPIYFITGGLHSPETGSPEMLMELAYRLAVSETPMIKAIRENVIFIFVPVAEPDGRDRMVDTYYYRKAHRDVGPNLVYWGHYVAHDNNRDGFGLSLALTRNILKEFLYWKPLVLHDLHESVPFLYVSTGTGPYNEYVDAITIDEWHNLAFEEVTQLTRRGMPGVWTHGFYTGWAANYMLWIANNRNAIGRFYETYGNAIADTKEREPRKSQLSKKWYRPNPPLKKADWSLRNNTNYMQSGVLIALKYMADNSRKFLENFYIKSRNAVNLGKEEAPHAWVIPADQERNIAAAELVNLLMQQGVEVHVAEKKLKWSLEKKDDEKKDKDEGKKEKKDEKPKFKEAGKGSYVVRLDQPYRTMARILLDKQNFPKDERPPYDDTGWTLPYLRQVKAFKVNDPEILSAKMKLLDDPVQVTGRVVSRKKKYYLLDHNTEDNFALFRFKLTDVRMLVAEEPFKSGKREYSSGSFIIPVDGMDGGAVSQIENTAVELGLVLRGENKLPDVTTHEADMPRIALMHTWVSTPQDAGWWQLAFDRIGVPYEYIAEQDLALSDLSEYDVIIMPRNWASPQRLVGGTTEVGDPVPWRHTEEYKHIGVIDETDDLRKGMGYEGLKNLNDFIRRGGVFLTEGSSSAFPIDMAITRRVSIKRTKDLLARGAVLRAVVEDEKSPIVYGYDDSLAVYFSQSPVFRVNKRTGGFSTPDWYRDEVWEKEVPRVVLKFSKKNLLMSGMLKGEKELAGAPVVLDVPVGDGHVVLFANRPFWRWETHGSHALVFNTILNWNDLRTGWKERPEKDEEENDSFEYDGFIEELEY